MIDNLEAAKSANVHHIIPVVAGGPDVPENLITLCEGCHSEAHRDMKHIHESNPELLGKLREVVCEDD
ncbi:HNH endonuclease [Halorubrum rutilum]|uniref:HNH endonuclease n=1 Tax=Halorubrum rutilum TaxID=1364933 RepID=A0ABD6AG83_9EURY